MKMAENLNTKKHLFTRIMKSEDVDKIVRLIIYLVMIYLLLKIFKVPVP